MIPKEVQSSSAGERRAHLCARRADKTPEARRTAAGRLLACSAGLALACGAGSGGGAEEASSPSSALTNAEVMGFENSSGWSLTSGTGTLASSGTRTQGNASLSAAVRGYVEMTSQALTSVPGATADIAYDLRIPETQPNPDWFGVTQLYVSIPSRNVFNAFVGQKELITLTPGTFGTVQLSVPAQLVTQLQASASDLTFKIVLNVPSNASGAYLLDNLRFVAGSQIPTEWPNAVSKANSDPWLVQHHATVRTLKPRVLVLDFDNHRDPATARTFVEQLIAAFTQGSRYHGYADPSAAPMLQYQLDKVVDLRDPAPSAQFPNTSSLFPRKPGTADYAQFFDDAFAARYGYPDPVQPGRFLNLCDLQERGIIHEVWIFAEPNEGDVPAAEVLEWSPTYDAQRNRIQGGGNPCAGNGCFEADVPHCAGSLRIGYINSGRGLGCYVHSNGHGMESKLGAQSLNGVTTIASVARSFREFADFDLDARHNQPFSTWYALPGTNPDPPDADHPCDYVKWTSPTSIAYTRTEATPACVDSTRTTISPYVPVCGSVHFPPNARRHYDTFNTFSVQSTCEGYRRREGAGGADLARPFSRANFSANETLAPDCQGDFLVWWMQNMPSFGSPAQDDSGQPMLSWLPYMFY
jgi:hypothetical protein